MTFLYPLGLLGLIGIPIVILIYILRSKYNEQTVTSTYLWELSEKFFKRKNPLSGLTGIISLILQIMTILVVSLAIARPIFVVPNSASEYCFVLDGSGSMNTKSGQETLFDKAKDEIGDIINEARLGSTYSLVYVSGESDIIYERISDKDIALEMLDELECSDGAVDYTDALEKAQKYFDKNPSTLVYLVTDKSYASHNNVEIVNVSSQNVSNYALSDVVGTLTNGKLSVSGRVMAYSSDAEINLELYVDGAKHANAKTDVFVKKGESTEVGLSCDVSGYESFRLVIANKDSLAIDNEVIIYNIDSESSYNILVVSETPFFIEAVLDSLTDSKVDTVSPEDYTGEGDYGLYIFHSYTPEELPDAAVWLINSSKSVADSGFGIRGIVEIDGVGKIDKSESSSTQVEKLLSGIDGKNIYISEYVKYSGMYTKFTTLFSYDSNPLIFAGVNALGNREVVFGFDLHKSDIAMSSDFAPLLLNLLNYSCPNLVDSTYYSCGETAYINITANISSVKAIAPDGEEIYIDTSTDTAALHLDKVGTYTIKVVSSGVEKSYNIYSGAPAEESVPSPQGETFSLSGEQKFERTDGEYDPLVLLFILLAIMFVADWTVYCYEKYQLR